MNAEINFRVIVLLEALREHIKDPEELLLQDTKSMTPNERMIHRAGGFIAIVEWKATNLYYRQLAKSIRRPCKFLGKVARRLEA